MSLQLFSFGHPCEHQLRRTCIGGSSCPLNGYPDNWCCSFIKGKINFKRDKPCEGPRCRWGFTHPSQSQFDAVTHVLNESRPIAAKLDDADDKEQLSFNIENSHLVDTVQCALHMMRHPPISRATRVGQLLAYAALRAADPKVFMQLLKTLKKPVDGYLLGAYDYLTSGKLPAPAPAAAAAAAAAAATTTNAQGKAAGKKGHSEKKEDASEELRNDMVDLMNAALSSGGQLVNREDQHTLQAVFIQALRSYPKSNKKRQEMLELAVAKFGSRPAAKSAPSTTTAAGQTAAAANAQNAATATAAAANTPRHAGVAGTTAAAGAAASGKAGAGTSPNAAATATAAAAAGGGGSSSSAAVAGGGGAPSKVAAALEEEGAALAGANPGASSSNSAASTRRPQAVGGASPPTTVGGARSKDASGASPARRPPATTQEPPPQRQMPALPPLPPPQPVVGISRVAQQAQQPPPRHYEPIRTDLPLPNVALCGGLFGLTPQSAAWALLGAASCFTPAAAAAASCGSPCAEAVAEVDEKLLRFVAASAPAHNFFSGLDGLPAEKPGMKAIYDD
ncbi:uncharacterized protein Tco025E_05212 [Trypanosoma conorhini]|uniref:Uncharacterized protein n=1 Tax=Trypanosoma conorhini TaxID=83891 RepID=A0A3R7P2Z8_9TRYP|nr:uncharacterized protein Tco025E_05212 [Trypanosoma conorhini]RNF16382.1 hypothetical protein Tco025E_05212 [Trypanosoma conorhini]